MAHYTWNESVPLGLKLRQGLDGLREARHKLLDVLGAMNSMTNTQITATFGFADDTASGNAKGEIASDVANLNGAIDAGGGTSAGRALQQMLDQFA